MTSLLVYTPPPSPCGYLPDRDWRLTYEHVGSLTPAEYQERLKAERHAQATNLRVEQVARERLGMRVITPAVVASGVNP